MAKTLDVLSGPGESIATLPATKVAVAFFPSPTASTKVTNSSTAADNNKTSPTYGCDLLPAIATDAGDQPDDSLE